MTEQEIKHLVAECASWQKAKKSLSALSECPLAQKRRSVYPDIITFLTREFEGTNKGYGLKSYVDFILGELEHAPELAASVFKAITSPVDSSGEQGYQFYRLVIGSREKQAVEVLRGMTRGYEWARALMAIDAAEMADALRDEAHMRNGPAAVAAGYYCGNELSCILKGLYASEYILEEMSLGVALLGNPADADWIRELRPRKTEAIAKRIHCALSNTRRTPRFKAINTIARSIRKQDTPVALLLCLCKLLLDDDVEMVERAALALKEYSRLGKKGTTVHHAILLRSASEAAANGLSKNARKALEAVVKKIPRSEELPQGPLKVSTHPVPKPAKKKAQVAKKKAQVAKAQKISVGRIPPMQFLVCTNNNELYILVKAWGYDEDDVRILYGSISGKTVILEDILDEPEDIVGLISLDGDAWSEQGGAAALGIDGTVFILNGPTVTVENIRTKKQRSKEWLGHMRTLKQHGDTLYALGYGGQVYSRTPDTKWAPVHSSRPDKNICFYDAIDTPSGLLVVGAHVDTGLSDEQHAALQEVEDDSDAYVAQLLNFSSHTDCAQLWRLDKEWEQISLPNKGARSAYLLTKSKNGVLVWTTWTVFQLDKHGLQEVSALSGRGADCICVFQDTTYFLTKGEIWVCEDNDWLALTKVPAKARIETIACNTNGFIAMSSKQVFSLQDDTWIKLSCKMKRDAPKPD